MNEPVLLLGLNINNFFFFDSNTYQDLFHDKKKNQTNLKKLEGMLMDVVNNLKYCRKILMPIHANFHWHLMVVSMEQRKFYDYNSLHMRTSDYEVERWVSDIFSCHFGITLISQNRLG